MPLNQVFARIVLAFGLAVSGEGAAQIPFDMAVSNQTCGTELGSKRRIKILKLRSACWQRKLAPYLAETCVGTGDR